MMGHCTNKVRHGVWGLRVCATALGGVLLLGAARYAVAAPPFTMSDVLHLKWVTVADISPGGSMVAYEEHAFDYARNSTSSEVGLVRTVGGPAKRVSARGQYASSPIWSPSGLQLLYAVRDGHGRGASWQLVTDTVATGAIRTLATFPYQPKEVVWSPDGRQIAFALFVPQVNAGSVAPRLPAKPAGARWGAPVVAEDRINYRWDGRGYLPKGYTHLFVMSSDGGPPRQITFGKVNDGVIPLFGGERGLVWSRDGKWLIFSANRSQHAAYEPATSQLYQVRATGGQVMALTHRNGTTADLAVSPDGTKIAYVGFSNRQLGFHNQTHLYVMNRDGSGSKLVMRGFDRDVSDPQWAVNGGGLFFQYVDEGVPKIAYVTLGGAVTTLAAIPGSPDIFGQYSSGMYSVSSDDKAFAFPLSTPISPAEVAFSRWNGRRMSPARPLTGFNAKLRHVALGKLTAISFKSTYDGRVIHGWVLHPPGFNRDRKYPLVLQIHGGPSLSYGPTFSALDQVLAGLGYVVLYINPRGSTSYGAAFADLINNDYPDHDYDDLMSGVTALIQKGFIDPNRLYVEGGSGGGVLSAWTVGHTHRFRAAVVVKPVINWYSWVLTADIGVLGEKFWMGGVPWKHLAHYMARSPISYVGNVTTPTMVMHGEEDYRTPGASAVQFYRALKMRHIPSMLVLIPGASHMIWEKPRNLLARVAYTTGWFACYGGAPVGSHTCPYPQKN